MSFDGAKVQRFLILNKQFVSLCANTAFLLIQIKYPISLEFFNQIQINLWLLQIKVLPLHGFK